MSESGTPHAAGTPLGSGLSSEVFAEGPDRVLKLYRVPFEPAAIENEFRASVLAHRHGLPVAQPLAILDRGERRGILFERLHGTTLMRHHAGNPVGLLWSLRRLARIQHAIHAAPAEGLPSQHARLRDEIGWARLPEEARARVLAALEGLPAGTALCHGDIHPGNVLCSRGTLRIIDWQKASAGNPAADVARTELMIRYGRIGRLPPGGRRIAQALRDLAAAWYVRCYRAVSGMPRSEIANWHLPVMAARLCGRRTDKDEEILRIVARLLRDRPAVPFRPGSDESVP